MRKIINYLKRILGITSLETRIVLLNKENQSIKKKLDDLRRINEFISKDNRLILSHIRFLNSQFFAASDIGDSKYQPSVVIILKKGNQPVVKTYQFKEKTVQEIHRILEGFGRDNTITDQPRHFPSPRFRY